MDNVPCDGLVSCMSDCMLLEIFKYLDHKDLVSVSSVCTKWYLISHDETLWKRRFLLDFELSFATVIEPNAKNSWLSEYIRLVDKIPRVESQVLNGHEDEVLHVAFSNNGSLFSTCSKDCTVKIWASNYPCELLYNEKNIGEKLRWKFAQFSQFNVDDSLLLVSGVKDSGEYSTNGEIAVFEIVQGTLTYRCRIVNRPYDIFGCWFSRDCLLTGDLHYFSNNDNLFKTRTDIWLYKASQQLENPQTPCLRRLLKFYNKNANTIRMVQTSKYVSDWVLQSLDNSDKMKLVQKQDQYDASAEVDKFHADGASSSLAASSCASTRQKPAKNETDVYRLLMFSTGQDTYTPHQIGFKLINASLFEKGLNGEDMFDNGQRNEDTKDMHLLKEQECRELDEPLVPQTIQLPYLRYPENPNDQGDPNDWNFVKVNFDFPDRVIDLQGHVIGLTLSSCERYLFVNVRPWPEGFLITNPWEPPPIAEQIEIRVIDLENLILLDNITYIGHKGFTANDECFFLFLDSSKKLVASASEDKFAYIWDRHYGKLIGQLPHNNIVNSVAFNKKDEEMLVTVSDDRQIKVWRSKNAIRKLKGQ